MKSAICIVPQRASPPDGSGSPQCCDRAKLSRDEVMSRPVGFTSPNRFLIYAHVSEPTSYPEEVHDAIQVCIPFPNARYTVHRHSTTGRAVVSQLGPQDILVIPAGQPHGVSWHRQAAIVSLLIDQDFVAEALEGIGLDLADGLTFRDPLLSAAGQRVWEVLAAGGTSRAMLDALATAIVYGIKEQSLHTRSLMQEDARITPLSKQQVFAIQSYIDARIGENISLDAMARYLNMSTWHFGRRLRASTGMSPHAFVTDQRFAHAQRLLRSTSASILEVAVAVGMTHSHFTRSFRSRFGISPRELRRQISG